MPVDPDRGRTHQLLLLSPVNRLHRIAELVSPPRLDLDERDQPVSLRHQVDVPMTAPEPPLQHTPPRRRSHRSAIRSPSSPNSCLAADMARTYKRARQARHRTNWPGVIRMQLPCASSVPNADRGETPADRARLRVSDRRPRRTADSSRSGPAAKHKSPKEGLPIPDSLIPITYTGYNACVRRRQ